MLTPDAIQDGGILIVDDVSANLQLLSDVLSAEGYNVRVAPDGFFALDSVAERLPSLILLDVKMPGIDGFEVCRRLKANDVTRAIPVIFLSAFQETSDKLQGFAAGGVDYIGKPFIAEEVVARVRTHLALHDLQKKLEAGMVERTRSLHTLSAGNMALLHARDMGELLNGMVKAIVEQGGYSAAHIILDGDCEARAGLADVLENIPPKTSGTQLTILDQDAPCLSATTKSIWQKSKIHTAIRLPLAIENHIPCGQLTVFAHAKEAFSAPEELLLLHELVENLTYGISALRSHVALERAMERTIQAVAATVELRDPYTAGHQRRVAEIAQKIARAMNMDENRIKGLYLAGVIHDIGKVSVPVEILSRPGRLSIHEMGIIREHSQAGFDIVKGIEFPWPVPEIILQHHERLDGSGYPNKLRDNEILPEAKILGGRRCHRGHSFPPPVSRGTGFRSRNSGIDGKSRPSLFR